MWPVCKKEFRQFFSSLTGYIAIVVFLLLNGLFLFVFPDTNILDFGYATLDKFFELAPWILLLLIPAITMRSLAEEFRSGTFEILQTRPLTTMQLVTGKYLGSLLVVLIALLPTIIYVISVEQLSNTGGLDSGATLGSYIGLIFLAGVFVAIGIWCSSFTPNAVVAFIASAFACFILYSGFNAISRIPALEAGADYYVEMLGIDFHYRSISRGVVDSRDIIYFLSIIILFLVLTARNLWKTGQHKTATAFSLTQWARSKYGWIALLVLLVVLNFLAAQVHVRADLTQEKRYTLSKATKKLMSGLSDRVSITVFLEGEMPAGFKKLANSTRELLQEFKESGKANIQFSFKKPGTGSDSTGTITMDSLLKLGLKPTNVRVQGKEGEGEEQRYLFPGALLEYGDRHTTVDLLQGQDLTAGLQSLNTAEALLEYKFTHAIQKISSDSVAAIGYLLGNGEPLTYNVYDLVERTLKPNYGFGFVPIDSVSVIPQDFHAIMIVKPSTPFTDQQKLKIDQYIMHGGKVIWLIDKLYAEMDSLERRQGDFIAFDRALNLDDQLFKYGVRINGDLVQDLQCDQLPLVVGNLGDQQQVDLQPWQYFPLLSSYTDNPISKNLDNVRSIFPNSIDTVKAPGIHKTVLLATSSNSRTLTTPALVSLNSVKTEADIKTFNREHIPVAVLLEGKFPSLFSNRLSQGTQDTLAQLYKQPYLPAAASENKMIVVADADIVSNVVTRREGPLPMGFNQFTNYQYANKDFILNCIEYLTNPSGILQTRSKDLTLRLLDPRKVESQKIMWQILNIGLPVLLVCLFGIVYQALRKRKYQA